MNTIEQSRGSMPGKLRCVIGHMNRNGMNGRRATTTSSRRFFRTKKVTVGVQQSGLDEASSGEFRTRDSGATRAGLRGAVLPRLGHT